MFRSVLSFALPAALLAVVGLTVPAAAVIDPLPIEPNQHFVGLVNGDVANAVIRTDCVLPSATGHPVADQYVEAQLNSPVSGANTGFTGTAAHSLAVSLDVATTTPTATIGTLSGYNIQLAIPTTITVPCSGSGVVVFAPAPTSLTAVSATVTVRLVSANG